MVAVANSQIPVGVGRERLRFVVGDALTLGRISLSNSNSNSNSDSDSGGVGAGQFTLITGAWVLNYAASLSEMTAMFTTIAANLCPTSGVFAGIVPPAVARADLDALAHETNKLNKRSDRTAMMGFARNYYERLESGDGWRTETMAGREGEGDGRVAFRNYHLAREVYEEGARRGGMKGRLEWRRVEMPLEAMSLEGSDSEFWREYSVSGVHIGLFVARRGGL